MTEFTDNSVRYLDELRAEAATLPSELANDLVADFRIELSGLNEEESRKRIQQLGVPSEVVASASEELHARPASGEAGIQRPDQSWYTYSTVALLLVGGLVIPFLGWIAGAVLLVRSRSWNWADKAIGLLALPGGGLASMFLLLAIPVASVESGGPSTQDGEWLNGGPSYQNYTSDPVLMVTLWVLAAIPLITAVYLLARASKRRRVSRATR